jgi:anti-sigma B factor antagonist
MALVRSEVAGEVRIIFLDEARLIDPLAIEQCYREIVEVLDKSEEKNVLLHFGRVAFLSSSALGILIRINKKCKEYKITLKLCNIIPDIYQVFKITGLNKVFDIYADAAKALASFKPSGLLGRKMGETTYEVT